MTLAQIRNFILTEVPEIIGHEDYPNVRLNQMINFAQREVQRQLSSLGYKKWIKEASPTTTTTTYAGDTVLRFTVPTDMLESPDSIIELPCSGTSEGSSTYAYAREVNIDLWREQVANLFLRPTSKRPAYFRLGNVIMVSQGSGTILSECSIIYEYIVTDLSSDSSTTEIPAEFEEFIIKKVVYEIKKDSQKLAEFNAELSNAYGKFKQKESDKTLTESKNKAVLQ